MTATDTEGQPLFRSEPATTLVANHETIAALERGASAYTRLHVFELEDGAGGDHLIPVAVQTDGGKVRVEMLRDVLDEVDRRAESPSRRAGTVELAELASLVNYVNRYQLDGITVAFAEPSPPVVTVVFDHDEQNGGAAGWRGDRAVYRCPLARQWQIWASFEGKALNQGQFGDLIEQNADDLRGGEGFADAAKMLEVARNLVIHQAGKFERKINPTTGEGTLVATDEHAATSTKIPRAFLLAVPVFEGSEELYMVEARIRFAMAEGRPVFSYLLHNKAKVFEAAFASVRAIVGDRCQIPVYVGKPPAPATVTR
jgi:uncharacterized protein YfdQ (DUF2303 family)